MAMGTRRHRQKQEGLWYRSELPEAPNHPFYRRLNQLLDKAGFDDGRKKRENSFSFQADVRVEKIVKRSVFIHNVLEPCVTAPLWILREPGIAMSPMRWLAVSLVTQAALTLIGGVFAEGTGRLKDAGVCGGRGTYGY
jgi:hypothetical protein